MIANDFKEEKLSELIVVKYKIMIQRIQSLFLLLACIAFLLVFAFDFASSDTEVTGVFADKVYNVMDNPILIVITALGAGLLMVSIFMFRNRGLQIKLGYSSMICAILLPIIAFLLIYNEGTTLTSNIEISNGIAGLLPIFVIVFVILSLRAIKKDDKLVKSMDRLR